MVTHSTLPVLVTKVTDKSYVDDVQYLGDILKISKSFPAAVIGERVKEVLEAPDLGDRLKFSLGYLAMFLIPYFSLAGLNSLYRDVAMTEVFAGLSIAILGTFVIYPIAWILGLAFNAAYETKYENA